MSRQTIKKIFSFVVLPTLLICTGWYANAWYEHHSKATEKRIKQGGFQFISPLLDVELPEGYNANREPIPFKHKVQKIVDQQIQTGKIEDISVYYRDLSDGPWIAINEGVKYNPASMMKVLIMGY
jgi:beta-lactamase class A